MTLPRQLSIIKGMRSYNVEACGRVDRVFVDGVHLPDCIAYDMDAGWAQNHVKGVWQPKVYGVVTVTEKQDPLNKGPRFGEPGYMANETRRAGDE
jgi:hypothetical protein